MCIPCRPKKLLYSSTDENFTPTVHELYDSSHKTEKVCRYDLDEMDTTWLTQYNKLRQETGMCCAYCLFRRASDSAEYVSLIENVLVGRVH